MRNCLGCVKPIEYDSAATCADPRNDPWGWFITAMAPEPVTPRAPSYITYPAHWDCAASLTVKEMVELSEARSIQYLPAYVEHGVRRDSDDFQSVHECEGDERT